MTWLITDNAFQLIVSDEGSWLTGYGHHHEWLGYGEGLTESERERIASLPIHWELRPSGAGRVKHYLELEGGKAPESAVTAVRMPSEMVITLGEIGEARWTPLLRAFEVYAVAPYPKYFRVNVPFEELSKLNRRSVALGQFLSGSLANSSSEEISVAFYFGTDLPEDRI